MDSWERSDETSLSDKKPFYSVLYLKDITDKEYTTDLKSIQRIQNFRRLMVEKGTRGGICHAIHSMLEQIINI